jgi:hypothetical protein
MLRSQSQETEAKIHRGLLLEGFDICGVDRSTPGLLLALRIPAAGMVLRAETHSDSYISVTGLLRHISHYPISPPYAVPDLYPSIALRLLCS